MFPELLGCRADNATQRFSQPVRLNPAARHESELK
jgi:hypothetical protein